MTVDTRRRSRKLSQELSIALDQVLTESDETRKLAIKEADKLFSSEMFRFYAAISDWEMQFRVNE
jgi:hypothetical protein